MSVTELHLALALPGPRHGREVEEAHDARSPDAGRELLDAWQAGPATAHGGPPAHGAPHDPAGGSGGP